MHEFNYKLFIKKFLNNQLDQIADIDQDIKQILSFLETSRSQAKRGDVVDALDALQEIGAAHGFV